MFPWIMELLSDYINKIHIFSSVTRCLVLFLKNCEQYFKNYFIHHSAVERFLTIFKFVLVLLLNVSSQWCSTFSVMWTKILYFRNCMCNLLNALLLIKQTCQSLKFWIYKKRYKNLSISSNNRIWVTLSLKALVIFKYF